MSIGARKMDEARGETGDVEASKVIARMVDALGLGTQSALARELGVSRGAVSDAKTKGKVPAEWLLRLFRTHSLNPFWLETGQGAKFLSEDEVRQSAGDGMLRGDCAEYEFVPLVSTRHGAGETVMYYAFRRSWLKRRGRIDMMRLLRVTGESMAPTFEDEDIVLVDLSQTEILVGKIYAVRMGSEIMIKRLERKPGKLVLVSDNRRFYEPLEVELGEPHSVEVLGRVIWLGRDIW